MIALMLALNFGISWWNCYAVGGIWVESRSLGGWIRVLAWSGAIQAAIGFSSVFLFVLGGAAFAFGVLPPKAFHAAINLWYLLIIIPALSTGLIITVHSWIAAYRERSLANMGTAAYNTFAQAYNMYNAFSGIGDAFKGVGEFFAGGDDDDVKARLILLVVGLVVLSLIAGGVLAAILIKKYAGRLPLPERESVKFGR